MPTSSRSTKLSPGWIVKIVGQGLENRGKLKLIFTIYIYIKYKLPGSVVETVPFLQIGALKLAWLLFSQKKNSRGFDQDRQSSISNELLDNFSSKLSVEDFNPDDCIEIWWKAKTWHQIRKRGRQGTWDRLWHYWTSL